MSVRAFLLLGALLCAGHAYAQGFAGLGTSTDGYDMPMRGKRFSFPADHGAHTGYKIEWWYVTANLDGDDGKQYGIQWTLFRSALKPAGGTGWGEPTAWMGHAAITTPEQHYVAERFARGGIGQAAVTASPFAAHIDDWQVMSRATGTADQFSTLSMSARGADFSYRLSLESDRPLVAHGDNGYSVKSAGGQASYYYSQPFYRVSGELTLPGGSVKVTGQAWLDREWSTQPLAKDQTGWDWFSLHFQSGEKLMGFRLRDSGYGYTSGTWITADGQAEALSNGDVTVTPLETTRVAERTMPIRWRIEVASKGVTIETRALNQNAWMATAFPYWEGPITFEGTKPGRGYLEMTGYK